MPLSGHVDDVVASVRAFQEAHGLVVDGIVGPKTTKALLSPPRPNGRCIAAGWLYDASLVRADILPVLTSAQGDIGVSEDPPGSNRGKRVDEITWPLLGIPWCAAAVSAWYKKRPGGSPFGRINSSHDLRDWGRRMGRIIPAVKGDDGVYRAALQPGDIFFIPTSSTHGHVGLVCHPSSEKPGCFSSMEGNSGDACWGRVRPVASVESFIRPAFDVTGEPRNLS